MPQYTLTQMQRMGRGRQQALMRRFGAENRQQYPRFVFAQANPFDRTGFYAKVPDQNTAPSSAFHTTDNLLIATNLTNASAVAFLPNINSVAVVATNNVGASSWTWPAAYAGGVQIARSAGVQAQYALVRPVAMGIRISSSLADATVTGFCHVCLYSANNLTGTTWQYPTSIAQMQDLPYYQKFTISELTEKKIVVVNKYLDQSAFMYRDPNQVIGDSTNTGFHNLNGFMNILVAVEGQVTGSSPITCEIIVHWEGQSLFTGVGQDGLAEPPNMPIMDATATVVGDSEAVSDGIPSSSGFVRRIANQMASTMGRAARDIGIAAATGVITNYAASRYRVPRSYLRDAAAALIVDRVVEAGDAITGYFLDEDEDVELVEYDYQEPMGRQIAPARTVSPSDSVAHPAPTSAPIPRKSDTSVEVEIGSGGDVITSRPTDTSAAPQDPYPLYPPGYHRRRQANSAAEGTYPHDEL